MKRTYTREKPIVTGSHLIAKPGCREARCRVKPVKGHRGRGCHEQPAKWSRGPEGGRLALSVVGRAIEVEFGCRVADISVVSWTCCLINASKRDASVVAVISMYEAMLRSRGERSSAGYRLAEEGTHL